MEGILENKFCTLKEINLALLGMLISLILLIKTWEFLTLKYDVKFVWCDIIWINLRESLYAEAVTKETTGLMGK